MAIYRPLVLFASKFNPISHGIWDYLAHMAKGGFCPPPPYFVSLLGHPWPHIGKTLQKIARNFNRVYDIPNELSFQIRKSQEKTAGLTK